MRNWGRHAHGTPLYQQLVETIADDEELLAVLNRIEHRPPPNLLLAGVQYLLFEDANAELAAYYPSVTEEPLPPATVGPVFRDYVLANDDLLVEIGNSRYTQTNECRRCVALLPLVMTAPYPRFHLVDVGASAGLNLALDCYRYDFGGVQWGPESPVLLQTEIHGALPSLHEIEVASRTGIDLSPVDARDPDSRRWLEALVWPDQAERRRRLRAALAVVAELDIEMVRGDAIDVLPSVMGSIPAGEPVVVMNSFILGQIPPAGRDRIEEIVDQARSTRPVHRVMMEILDVEDDWARLVVDDGSGARRVGQAHPHGEWIELA